MKKLNYLIGCLLIIIGSLIVWGWLSDNIKIINYISYGAFIRFVTATWFIVVGINFLLLEKYPKISFVLGIIITFWTLSAFIFEYIYPHPILNNIFKSIFHNTVLTETPAPNSCICFAFIGSIF